MPENTSETVELNTPKSWEISRAYAQKIGDMPQSFTSSIRMLLIDHEKNDGKISNANVTQTALLLNSDSLKAMFYYAVKTFRGDAMESGVYLTKRKLATFFNPQELACIMAISLLYRRCKKVAPADLFENIARDVKQRVNAGGFIGQTIPHIGLGWGVLVGGVRLLGEVAFILHDKDGYQKYLNKKKSVGVAYDVDFETSRWGCTSIQIGANLLQNIGLGLYFGDCLTAGLDPRTPEELIKEDKFYRVKVTQLWINSLLKTGDIPQITHRGNYYPVEAELEKLKANIKLLSDGNSGDANWLDKNKSDVSETHTPELFKNGAAPPATSTSIDAPPSAAEGDLEEPVGVDELSEEALDESSVQELEEELLG